MSARGTSNSNSRGSAESRRARKAFLLIKFGDGYTAPCHYCQIELDWHTITVDRIVPGARNGTYRRNNIRPACLHDNSVDGNELRMELKREREMAA